MAQIKACSIGAGLTDPENNPSKSRSKIVDSEQLKESGIALTVYPNPFEGAAQVQFHLLEEQQISLHLFDQSGRLIETLLPAQIKTAGEHQVTINDDHLFAGLFYVILQSDKERIVKKVMVMKDGRTGRGDDD